MPRLIDGRCQEGQQGTRLLDLLGDVLEPAGVIAHHVPDDLPHVPARIGVVADIGDAVLGEVVDGDAQDLVLHLRIDPREHAVADDVVERPPLVVDVDDRCLPDPDVGQPERLDRRLRGLDLAARQIDADELGAGQIERHRDQVAAAGAPEFEDAAVTDRRRRQTEQSRDRRQAIGMRLRECQVAVGNVVVRVSRDYHPVWLGRFNSTADQPAFVASNEYGFLSTVVCPFAALPPDANVHSSRLPDAHIK